MGRLKNLRLFGGVHFSELEVHQLIYGANATGSNRFTLSQKSEFGGVGPRVGVELNYALYNGWTLKANGAINLLVGSQDYQNEAININATQIIDKAHKMTVVPAVDTKLGISFARPMLKGKVSVDGGWQLFNYFNSVITQDAQDQSDFAVQGVYFGINWVGELV